MTKISSVASALLMAAISVPMANAASVDGQRGAGWYAPAYEFPDGSAEAGTWSRADSVRRQADSVLNPADAPYAGWTPVEVADAGDPDSTNGLQDADPNALDSLYSTFPAPSTSMSSRFDIDIAVAADDPDQGVSVTGCVGGAWSKDASGEEVCPTGTRADVGTANFRVSNTSASSSITYTVTYSADGQFDGAATNPDGSHGAVAPCPAAPTPVTVASGTLSIGGSAAITWPGGGPVIGAGQPASVCQSGHLVAEISGGGGYSKTMEFRIFWPVVPN